MQWISTLKNTFRKIGSLTISPFKLLMQYSLGNALSSEKEDEIKNAFISSDFGVEFTENILKFVKSSCTSSSSFSKIDLQTQLCDFLVSQLPKSRPLRLTVQDSCPQVILFVGVNGGGKTTSLAKLAYLLKNQNYSVSLGAGDTFRAAAVEQLRVWSQKLSLPMTAQKIGADPAAVLFDAVSAAKKSKSDFLLADTAGRLNQPSLAQELKKIVNVLKKNDPRAPHEVFCVLDATLGQNSLNQVRWFHETIGITGLILTKLDGTAKGGIIFEIYKKLQIPIRYVGFGEEVEKFELFDSTAFVKNLLKDL